MTTLKILYHDSDKLSYSNLCWALALLLRRFGYSTVLSALATVLVENGSMASAKALDEFVTGLEI